MLRTVRVVFLMFAFFLATTALDAAWLEIQTEHTRIIFEEGEQIYAHEVASFADPVFLDIARLVGNSPDKRVPVIISSRPAFANGYYASLPSNIVLYVTGSTERNIGSRTSNSLKSLYIHELTHYLHLTSSVGPAKYVGFLGSGVTFLNQALMPYWWIEGITTYAETAYAQGGRGDAERFALTYQVPIAENDMWSLAQGAYDSGNTPLGRYYKTGYVMLDYLLKTYGEGSFSTINADFAAFPLFGISPAIRRETGHSAKEIFQAAIDEQRAAFTFIPDTGVQLSPSREGSWFLPSMTSIGLVGFSYSPDTGGALYRYPKQGDPSVLARTQVSERTAVALGEDFAIIAMLWVDSTSFSSYSPTKTSYSDFFELDLHTLKTRQITKGQLLYQPDLSPDGKSVVATQRSGTKYRLVSVDRQSGEISVLLDSGQGSYYEPSYSPDGKQIACVYIEGGNSSLLLITANGEVSVLAGPTQEEILAPAFDAQGNILFSASLSSYRYSIADGNLEKLHASSQGVSAAHIIGGDYLYETYTSKGYAVRSLPIKSLNPTRATLKGPQVPAPLPSIPSLESKSYHDWLQLNLVLPFPFVNANKFEPGVWVHSTSLLEKHSLIGFMGWSLATSRLLADLDYKTNVGPITLYSNLKLNQYNSGTASYFDSLSGSVLVPVWERIQPFSLSSLDLNFSLSGAWNETAHAEVASLSLGFSSSGVASPADYYGPSYISGQTSYQLVSNSTLAYRFNFFLSSQSRVFDSHSMIGISLHGTYSPTLKSGSLLSLHGFTPLALGDAKVTVQLDYKLPIAMLDQSIPYGGLTALGTAFFAQTALYLNGGSLGWEQAVALGTRVTASTVLGGRKTPFKPYIEFAYLLGQGSMMLTIGVDAMRLVTW